MKKLIVGFLLVLTPLLGMSAGGGAHLDDADLDMGDQASLQRGAKYFVNYCLSCHSAKYQRYNRTARDLGLTEDEVKENLMFTTDKFGETMTIAMDAQDAETWFGVAGEGDGSGRGDGAKNQMETNGDRVPRVG